MMAGMTEPPARPSTTRLAAALGAAAGLAVVLTIGGPGVTSDEPLDVRVGRSYLDKLGRWLIDGRPAGPRPLEGLFADNRQHPPLGRLLVGIASVVAEPVESWLGGPDPFGVYPARLAPAVAFGLLVWLLAAEAGRRWGRAGAVGAAVAMVAMPRVFAHAHFATLDTILCLFWTLALLMAERGSASTRPARALGLAGIAWGLALLTKINAWLLPAVVVVRVIQRLGWRRGVVALTAWLAAGLATFFVGWPWLWRDTAARLRAYLGTSVDRLPLRVEYFGQVYVDREVPWHYPWVYFAATVPVGLLALGAVGVVVGWRRRREDGLPIVLVATVLLWLAVFSTGAPVYDGERLFLVVFPAWALLVGRGFAAAWSSGPWNGRWGRLALGLFLAAQGYGTIAMHPFGLSYYNALVGGLPGAERLGLELTYWGDAVDGRLLDDLAGRLERGEPIALAPTLHPAQAVASTTPAILERGGAPMLEEGAVPRAAWVVIYRRRAYWTPEVARLVAEGPPVVVRSRQGVWLSGIWKGPGRPPGPR